MRVCVSGASALDVDVDNNECVFPLSRCDHLSWNYDGNGNLIAGVLPHGIASPQPIRRWPVCACQSASVMDNAFMGERGRGLSPINFAEKYAPVAISVV